MKAISLKTTVLKLLIASGMAFGLVFICSFFHMPFSSFKLYSMERKMVFNKILSSPVNYSLSETLFSKIYYSENDAEYVSLIGNAADLYYPLILNDFMINAASADKPTFVIFPNEEALRDALGLNYSAVPMGVYYAGIINVLSPYEWIREVSEAHAKERFVREGPLVHEMIHLATDLKAEGNYPIWFTEGVALYYENKLTAFEWRPDLRDVSKEITVSELSGDFRGIDEGTAYRRAFDIISAFVESYGEQALQSLLEKLGNGADFERLWHMIDLQL